MSYPKPPDWVTQALIEGLVIPAHPLALTKERVFDERRQRALTRYYHAAGAGGVAVGVHTTQFEIRDAKHGLFEPVLAMAAEEISALDEKSDRRTVRIAGIAGPTAQAVAESRLASDLRYHAGLLSLAAVSDADEDALIEHCRAVAEIIPLVGFYLQPAVGGRVLPLSFWRRFLEIPNVAAIKVAPFNRYRTYDVVRALAESNRQNEIPLYTGNDDSIVLDLLTTFAVPVHDSKVPVHFAGGLLGHWACWTRKAVDLLETCKRYRTRDQVPADLLTLAAEVTDANAAFFDAANDFRGVIAGIHEVLFRQGLLSSIECLDPEETLSPGQREEIDRVHAAYPHLNDDAFVAEHLEEWLA